VEHFTVQEHPFYMCCENSTKPIISPEEARMSASAQITKPYAIDFYEFTGVIIPGSLFDFGSETLDPILTPDTFGGLGVHIILAYITGHLIQALGNWLEKRYWALWGGMPTDWPITRPQRKSFPKAIEQVCTITKEKQPSGSMDDQLRTWKRLVSEARSTVYKEGRASRIQVFNGNYGMFRGVLSVILIVAATGWLGSVDAVILYPVLFGLAILTRARMHRFAEHYSRELFANVAAINRERDNE
jgi:hypothetical protein